MRAGRINLTVRNLTVSSIEVTDSDLHNGNVIQARAHAYARVHMRMCINSGAHSNCEIYMHYEEK